MNISYCYLREQTPKAQIMLLGQSFWTAHCWILVHPTVGSPVCPGAQEQRGVWLMVVHWALPPQTPSSLHTSTHWFFTQDFPESQSLFSMHCKVLHSLLASPVVLAGHEQNGRWSTTEQTAPRPQRPMQGSTQRPKMLNIVSHVDFDIGNLILSYYPTILDIWCKCTFLARRSWGTI